MSLYVSPADAQGFAVEVHVGDARTLPGFGIIGAPLERVRLVRDRVDEMLASNGFELPARRVTVNVLGPWRPNITIAQAIYDGLRALEVMS